MRRSLVLFSPRDYFMAGGVLAALFIVTLL